MTDDELLAYVGSERKRSVGFDNDADLTADREKALNYSKGEMPDVPALPNRSKAVSTDVIDAIETILPDLVEIFTGGDDVATFIPRGEEDEQAAQQETDYVNYAVFQENDGWLTLYAMFKDALQLKTGVVKYCWEDEEPEEETLEGVNAIAIEMAAKDGQIIALEPVASTEDEQQPEALYNVTVRKPARGKLKVMAWPPEDFSVAADTVRLPDATYCAARSRVRAQQLIADGIPADKVAMLSSYSSMTDDAVGIARDTASEFENGINGADSLLRTVEVVEHYIRILDGKKLKLWRVLTGKNETVLLDKEEVERIQFAAITPYIVTHRFYGQSVADKLLEIQKINTALTRMMLDSGYFALNQRMMVLDDASSPNTIPDLLRNEPGVPIRVKRTDAVVPITAGSPNFDFFNALEFMQTKAEQRTGIVRAAQGLTPDTLHETAKGAMALLTQAQKRVRLIARIFAETGIKDLFLGAHAVLRKHCNQTDMKRLRNEWVQVAPTSWGERADMTIEIGVGAAGKEAEMQSMQMMAAIQQQIVAAQGGPAGPLVNVENIYNLSRKMFEKLGAKAPEKYISDPKNAPPQPPKPDPEAMKAQAELQIKQQSAQADAQLAQQKAQADAQLQAQKGAQQIQIAEVQGQRDHELAMTRLDAEMSLKREQIAAELQLKREQLVAELELKRELGFAQTQSAHEQGMYKASVSTSEVTPGGDPG